jgi:hypothetical protein
MAAILRIPRASYRDTSQPNSIAKPRGRRNPDRVARTICQSGGQDNEISVALVDRGGKSALRQRVRHGFWTRKYRNPPLFPAEVDIAIAIGRRTSLINPLSAPPVAGQ